VEAIASNACDGFEMVGGCQVRFIDVSPIKKGDCPSSTTEERMHFVSEALTNAQTIRATIHGNDLMIQGNDIHANCKVYDVHGLLVFARDNVRITESLSVIATLPALAPGIYLVQIEGPELRNCSKVIVE
jgi:hypothetical protein